VTEAVDLALALAAAGRAAGQVEAEPADQEPSSPPPAQHSYSPGAPEIPPSQHGAPSLHGPLTQPGPHSQHAHPPQPPTVHHLTLTVSDVDRSATWYQSLIGPAEAIRRTGPGWQRIRMQWSSGLVIGVTAHDTTPAGDAFDHGRVGLDHVGLSCRNEAEVRLWARRLDEIGAIRGPVEDVPYGWAVTGRDTDSIPVEFFAPK
jgi:catechol 2,3-dioxygenase-like lactoylglutathione lyase family enzyme